MPFWPRSNDRVLALPSPNPDRSGRVSRVNPMAGEGQELASGRADAVSIVPSCLRAREGQQQVRLVPCPGALFGIERRNLM